VGSIPGELGVTTRYVSAKPSIRWRIGDGGWGIRHVRGVSNYDDAISSQCEIGGEGEVTRGQRSMPSPVHTLPER